MEGHQNMSGVVDPVSMRVGQRMEGDMRGRGLHCLVRMAGDGYHDAKVVMWKILLSRWEVRRFIKVRLENGYCSGILSSQA
jgi:hypothetical protein